MKEKPGIDILNTGAGHAEVNFDHSDPIEMERGKRIIEDMLKRGYLLFIHGDDGKMVKVERFNPEKGTYIIGDCALYAGATPLETEKVFVQAGETQVIQHAEPKRRGRPPKGEVKMTEARVTSIGRSAGG